MATAIVIPTLPGPGNFHGSLHLTYFLVHNIETKVHGGWEQVGGESMWVLRTLQIDQSATQPPVHHYG